MRTPARDAMLSHASQEVGTGLGFGLHEALDQIGAVSGPLIVAGALFLGNNRYQAGFAVLLIPALIALVVLFVSLALYRDPKALEVTHGRLGAYPSRGKLPPVFWLYTLFTSASIAGYTHFQLISYHFRSQAVVPDVQIPIVFAVAMGVDALVALPIGRLFDKKGLLTLVILPLVTLPIPFLVFSRVYYLAFLGMTLWGAAMGIQETTMRAAIAEITSPDRRGLAYGVFNTSYGVAWFLGSSAMGVLYGLAIPYAIAFGVALELVSLPLLLLVRREVVATGGNSWP